MTKSNKIKKNSLKKSIGNHYKLNTKKLVQKKDSFPIIAIGASAGGLEAIENFFTHLPVGSTGMAYVIITHLDRNHVSILPDLLKKFTVLPVLAIKDRLKIKKDTIYVLPPKKNVLVNQGRFQLVEQGEPHYQNLPINYFFISLAHYNGENAVAIVLSGSGADGTLGLREIKENGGLTMVQTPLTASFDSMPQSAIKTGLVDYILDVEAMPEQLKEYFHYGQLSSGKLSPELKQIMIVLRMRTGYDFSHYKLNTICRRTEKHMQAQQISSLKEYVHFLRVNPHEIDSLFNDLLIGVTRFFRDAEAYDTLKNMLITILKNKSQGYEVRIWVAACSTGEEAYSIAIILCECMAIIGKEFNIQIFATDIDEDALKLARSGIYPEAISTDVNATRLNRFFTKDHHNRYKVKNEIRSKVIFGVQNIIKDPPFTKLDLICCRNLLIYFQSTLQKKVLPMFHYSLKPKGILFLGKSEATSGFPEYFELIAKKAKIFQRKDTVTALRALSDFDGRPYTYDDSLLPPLEQEVKKKELNFKQEAQAFILNHYTVPCMIINKSGEILYSNSSIDKLFGIHNNNKTINIFNRVYSEVKPIILSFLHEIKKKSHEEALHKSFTSKIAKKKVRINMRIICISHKDVLRDLVLIVFEEPENDRATNSCFSKSKLERTNQKLVEVMEELRYTKEDLQATIEELESGNEELQSTNEELQSTNEEIETSKEELQSLNEELMIVNTELQATIDQLACVNDDMNNLFNSTEIAAFFLDNNLRIKRFTPKAKEFMHLLQSDIGRPFSHFSSTIQSDKLIENAEDVLKTLCQKNYQVETKGKKWYQICILPYRTLANMIDGVVITLTDITQFKDYENKMQQINQELNDALLFTQNIVNTIREPLIVLNEDLKIVSANNSFYKLFKLKESKIIGQFIYDVGAGQLDNSQLKKLLSQVLSKKQTFDGFPINCNLPKLGIKKLLLNARRVKQVTLDSDLVLVTFGYQ